MNGYDWQCGRCRTWWNHGEPECYLCRANDKLKPTVGGLLNTSLKAILDRLCLVCDRFGLLPKGDLDRIEYEINLSESRALNLNESREKLSKAREELRLANERHTAAIAEVGDLKAVLDRTRARLAQMRDARQRALDCARAAAQNSSGRFARVVGTKQIVLETGRPLNLAERAGVVDTLRALFPGHYIVVVENPERPSEPNDLNCGCPAGASLWRFINGGIVACDGLGEYPFLSRP